MSFLLMRERRLRAQNASGGGVGGGYTRVDVSRAAPVTLNDEWRTPRRQAFPLCASECYNASAARLRLRSDVLLSCCRSPLQLLHLLFALRATAAQRRAASRINTCTFRASFERFRLLRKHTGNSLVALLSLHFGSLLLSSSSVCTTKSLLAIRINIRVLVSILLARIPICSRDSKSLGPNEVQHFSTSRTRVSNRMSLRIT